MACCDLHCLHMGHHSVVKLRDGRSLSYRLAGYPAELLEGFDLSSSVPSALQQPQQSPQVPPKATVLYHHGWPSSAAEVVAWDKPAAAQGVQVVAVDRPGVGFSTFNPSGK